MSTEEKFHAAVNVIRNLPKNGAYQPSHEMKLKFYAYFKQATEGPCSISKPSFWDIIGKSKYDAWNKLGNMTKKEAMENYVEELKKIVETMSYNDNVGVFLGSLGDFYDSVPAEDIEMVLGPVIDRVRTLPGSPLRNSPFGSREASPSRISRTLTDKTNVSSSETSPASTASPSPRPPDTDDENEEFIDTVEVIPSNTKAPLPPERHQAEENNAANYKFQTTPHPPRKAFKVESPSAKTSDLFKNHNAKDKPDKSKTSSVTNHANNSSRNGNCSSFHNGRREHGKEDAKDSPLLDRHDSPRPKIRERESPSFAKRKSTKTNGASRTLPSVSSSPDLSEPLRDAVLHLQKDLDRITARVRTLEVSLLSAPQVGFSRLRNERFFPDVSLTTFTFIVVWPFLVHLLMRFMPTKKISYCE